MILHQGIRLVYRAAPMPMERKTKSALIVRSWPTWRIKKPSKRIWEISIHGSLRRLQIEFKQLSTSNWTKIGRDWSSSFSEKTKREEESLVILILRTFDLWAPQLFQVDVDLKLFHRVSRDSLLRTFSRISQMLLRRASYKVFQVHQIMRLLHQVSWHLWRGPLLERREAYLSLESGSNKLTKESWHQTTPTLWHAHPTPSTVHLGLKQLGTTSWAACGTRPLKTPRHKETAD